MAHLRDQRQVQPRHLREGAGASARAPRKYIYRQGEVYRCRDCHGFHVGRPAKELKALNRRLRA